MIGKLIDTKTYYTSSLFVNPLREDAENLSLAFIARCQLGHAENEGTKPYEWFKEVWKSQGWHLYHLRCISARPRKAFLETVFRIFLGESRNTI